MTFLPALLCCANVSRKSVAPEMVKLGVWGGSCVHMKGRHCVRLDVTFLSKPSLIPGAAHDSRLPLLNIP